MKNYEAVKNSFLRNFNWPSIRQLRDNPQNKDILKKPIIDKPFCLWGGCPDFYAIPPNVCR
jgi:hypothetical protein